MKIVMTDDLTCKFTWSGDKQTKKFYDTRICNVLFYKKILCVYVCVGKFNNYILKFLVSAQDGDFLSITKRAP